MCRHGDIRFRSQTDNFYAHGFRNQIGEFFLSIGTSKQNLAFTFSSSSSSKQWNYLFRLLRKPL